jgi:hypothetical protein
MLETVVDTKDSSHCCYSQTLNPRFLINYVFPTPQILPGLCTFFYLAELFDRQYGQ